MSRSLDYYHTSESIEDCAYWIAFLRLYAYVRTPACIYSNLITRSSHVVRRKTRAIAIPDYVSNILVELNNIVDAREAEVLGEGISMYDECVDHEMLYELILDGILPDRHTTISSTFRPGAVELCTLSMRSVVRLEDMLSQVVARATGTTPQTAHTAIARAVAAASHSLVPVAPLWLAEVRWVESVVPYRGPLMDVERQRVILTSDIV